MVVAVMVGRPSLAALMLGRTFDRLTIRTNVVLPVLLILAGEGFAVLAFAPNLWATFLGVVLVGGHIKASVFRCWLCWETSLDHSFTARV